MSELRLDDGPGSNERRTTGIWATVESTVFHVKVARASQLRCHVDPFGTAGIACEGQSIASSPRSCHSYRFATFISFPSPCLNRRPTYFRTRCASSDLRFCSTMSSLTLLCLLAPITVAITSSPASLRRRNCTAERTGQGSRGPRVVRKSESSLQKSSASAAYRVAELLDAPRVAV